MVGLDHFEEMFIAIVQTCESVIEIHIANLEIT